MTSKKIISALLCAAAVLGMTACTDEQVSNPASGGTAPSTTPVSSSTANTLDDDINNPVDISDFVTDKTLDNPNLTYYGYYDMRVAGDIKPGVKLFEETYGGKIDYIYCSWNERIDGLQVLIAGGDSPDLVDREDISYPNLMSKNVYEDLTNYIDLSQPQWEDYIGLIEQYEYNGAHYYYPFTANALPNCLIYDKDLFHSLAITDPKQLYDEGNWTWDTFKQTMMQFTDLQPGALGGVYGIVGNDIMMSTGTALIGIDDGKIVNNMDTADIDRAASYLMDLRREGLTVRGDGMWSNEPAPLAKGLVAFLGVGQWKITDFCKDYPDREFGFVPYPRDPNADKYYYNSSAFGYMVPKGSKNVEGAAAFINIMRECNTDPELMAVVKESIMNDKQYTEEQYDFLTSFQDIGNFDMVVNVSGGFDENLTGIIDDMLINLCFETDDDKGWAQLRGEWSSMITELISGY